MFVDFTALDFVIQAILAKTHKVGTRYVYARRMGITGHRYEIADLADRTVFLPYFVESVAMVFPDPGR